MLLKQAIALCVLLGVGVQSAPVQADIKSVEKREDADAAYLIAYKDKREDADAAYLIAYKDKREDADAAYLIAYKDKRGDEPAI